MNNTLIKTGLSAALAAGVMFSAAATANEIKVGGRIMVDAGVFDEDDDNTELLGDNGTEFRRARLFAKGNVVEEFDYKLQIDFAGNEVDIKDAYIATKVGGGKIYAGQFKMAGGLEEQTSSKYITLMERSALSGFFPSRRIGFGYKWNDAAASIQTNIYGQEEAAADDDAVNEEGLGASVRGTFAFKNDDLLFHIGGSAGAEQPKENNGEPDSRIRLRFRPEYHLTGERPVNLQSDDPERKYTLGLEGALVAGPFFAQAELVKSDITSEDNDEEVDGMGFAVTSSFFINGHKNYKKGTFGRPKINGDMAVELAARYSYVELEKDDLDQDMGIFTIGANLYFNKYTRLMFNYSFINAEQDGGGASDFDDDANAFQTRFQIDF